MQFRVIVILSFLRTLESNFRFVLSLIGDIKQITRIRQTTLCCLPRPCNSINFQTAYIPSQFLDTSQDRR